MLIKKLEGNERALSLIYTLSREGVVLYVGQTSKGIMKRYGHTPPQHNRTKCASWLKKYWDDITLTVVEACPIAELNEREIYWIEHFSTYIGNNPEGLNFTLGGETTNGFKHSDETKALISEKVKERFKESREWYKAHSEEAHAKRVASLQSEEVREKISRGVRKSLEERKDDPSSIKARKQAAQKSTHQRWHVSREVLSTLCSLCMGYEIDPAKVPNKFCTGCSLIQDLQEFALCSNTKDGRSTRCKACQREAHRKRSLQQK